MRPAALALTGITAYVFFLAVTFPATVALQRLPPAAAAWIAVHEASGTVWNGHARATLTPPHAAPIALESVAWRFKAGQLARGRIMFAATFSAAGVAGSLEAGRGLSGWIATDLRAKGDAKALALFMPIAAAWRPEGEIEIEVPRAEMTAASLRGEGHAEWRGASVALSEVRPLGSYRARWTADGGPGRVQVTTLEGPLRIAGEGVLTAQGRLSFSGEARGEGESAGALEPLLDLLGPRRPDGARRITLH